MALIITVIHLDVPTTGGAVLFFVAAGTTTCSGSGVGNYQQMVNLGAVGEIDIPLAPGLGIPAGDSLCAEAAGTQARASVSGYTVPVGTVAAGSSHALPPLP